MSQRIERRAATLAPFAVLWLAAACGETTNPAVQTPRDAATDAPPLEDQFAATDYLPVLDEGTSDVFVPDMAPIPDVPVAPPDDAGDGDGPASDGSAPPGDARGDGPPTPSDGGPDATDGPVAPTDGPVAPSDGPVAPADEGPPCVPAEEICDGQDNDCDREVDEDFEIGLRCEGDGVCGPGAVECLDPMTAICSTEAGGTQDQSAAESCNGLDDDCDGETDEGGLGEPCYTGPAGTAGVGLCHPGGRACVDGRISAACAEEVVPAAEICDGQDNDCDGQIDEDVAVESQCGVGACRTRSTPGVCRDGVLVACQPGQPAADDTLCNGQDDDCDGQTDEEYVPVTGCGVGRCGEQAIASRCLRGVEQPCIPAPPMANDSSCNDVDDDCNGEVDEDFRGQAQCGVGVCQATSVGASCVDGRETACTPGPTTGDDTDCDGLDDDCDGIADEAYVRVGGCGVGVCGLSETPSRCVDGRETACQPGAPFDDDDAVCDGLDSDCDGRTDEDYESEAVCGVGVCAASAQPSTCVGGVETDCRPGAPLAPTDTTCDRQDDDCDGDTDEDAPVVAAGGEVRITNSNGDGTRPQAVFNGNGYAAVWADNRSGRGLIYFARFDRSGVRQGGEVVVTNLIGTNSTPSIAWSGQTYAVVWQGTPNGRGQIHGSLLNANGQLVQGATDFGINQAFNAASAPRVIWNGAEFLVAWQMGADVASQDIYTRRVTALGVPTGDENNVSGTASSSSAPALVWNTDRQEAGLVWTENEPGNGDFNVYFGRTNANGVRVGALERLTNAESSQSAPAVAWNGNEYGVVWQDLQGTQDIAFMRVDAAGLRQGAEVLVAPAVLLSSAPSIAWDGTRWGVAWYDRRANNNDEIWFARVTTPAAPGPAYRLTSAAGTSFLPWLLYSGQEFAVFWYDNRDGNQEIYFTRGPFGCP